MKSLSFLLMTLVFCGCHERAPLVAQAPASPDEEGGAPEPAPPEPEPASSCGNGRVDEGERCDDGNRVGGDGCSSDCRLEAVALIDSDYALDSQGYARALPGGYDTYWDGLEVIALGNGTILDKRDPLLLPHGSRSYRLPSQFAGRVSLISGMSQFYIVALDDGELWRMVVHLEPSTACREMGLEEPGLLAPDGKRWCRNKWNGGPLRDLDHWWVVDQQGQLFYVNHRGATRVKVPPVQQVSVTGGPICVLLERGEIGCWGLSRSGEFGYMGEGPEGTAENYVAEDPPDTFLKFPTPAEKVLSYGEATFALTEGGEVWCWGDCGERPFADTGEPEPYWYRAFDGDPAKPQERKQKPVGASTIPSAPLALPVGCTAKDMNGECVLCTDGCVKCWRDKESLASAECITF